MTITAAHISPIVALIAGLLILIMPRFLNFIVAIYLIVVCACAAIGAAIVPAIAAMANSLFRMVCSFARERRLSPAHTTRSNSSRAALFRKKTQPYSRPFWGIVAEAGTR
jgi:hypothetical protein